MDTRAVLAHTAEVGRMASWLASKCGKKDMADDLAQEGLLALLAVVRRTGSTQWDKYGRHVVLNSMKDYARRERTKGLDDASPLDEQMVCPKPNPEERASAFDAALGRLKKLSFREQQIIVRSLVGESDREIADTLGVSAQRVGQQHNRALEKLAA